MKVMIVGLNPSPANVDPLIPFVGTKSYETLTTWEAKVFAREDCVKYANLVDDIVTSNSSSIRKSDIDRNVPRFLNEVSKNKPDLIVALGSKVYATISSYNYFSGLGFERKPIVWCWPHPSPSNRFLNNKNEVKKFFDEQHIRANFLRFAR